MLVSERIRRLFESGSLFERNQPEDDAENPVALPDAALSFLTALAHESGARTALEFGSGRSTAAFLRAGLDVTSVEDSAFWMNKTRSAIGDLKLRHNPVVRPLSVVWRHATPFLDWQFDDRLTALVRAADIILIDSPFYPPFRESTLLSVLEIAEGSIVLLDDTRIPTLQRFCDRIGRRNPTLLHRRVPVGHSFDVFCPLDHSGIDGRCPLIEVIKGWRRFMQGREQLMRSSTEIGGAPAADSLP